MENPCSNCYRARLEAIVFEEVTCYLRCEKFREWIIREYKRPEASPTPSQPPAVDNVDRSSNS